MISARDCRNRQTCFVSEQDGDFADRIFQHGRPDRIYSEALTPGSVYSLS
jgi:hypothetical protein